MTAHNRSLPNQSTAEASSTQDVGALMAEEAQGRSIADSVFQQILELIHRQKLKVGDRLPSEGKLALELGASRGTVREAIRALAQLNILSVQNGKRAEVAEFRGDSFAVLIDHAVKTSQVSVIQTWDLRRTLELRISRLAALRRNDEDVARMRGISAKMLENTGDRELLTQCDVALHLSWAIAAKNPLFELNMRALRLVMLNTGPIGWAALGGAERLAQHVELHSEISEAIANRDADLAEELMLRHFDDAAKALHDAGLD